MVSSRASQVDFAGFPCDQDIGCRAVINPGVRVVCREDTFKHYPDSALLTCLKVVSCFISLRKMLCSFCNFGCALCITLFESWILKQHLYSAYQGNCILMTLLSSVLREVSSSSNPRSPRTALSAVE